MSERRTGPWTKEEHEETNARVTAAEARMDLGDEELLRDEAVWMGSEALPRALAEIARLNRAAAGFGEDEQAITAEVERRANDLCAEHVSFGLGMAHWRGIVRPGVEREARLKISSDAGWAIAKARLECLDKLEGPLPLTLSNALRDRVAALPPEGGSVYFVNNAGSEDDALSCAARSLILDLASERGFTVAIDRQGVNHAENFILRPSK